MIPGSVSKLSESTIASAATIRVRTDIVRLTGTVQVNNIISSMGSNQGVLLILIPTDGAVILGTTGNILVGQTTAINRALFLVFVKSLNKWVMSSGGVIHGTLQWRGRNTAAPFRSPLFNLVGNMQEIKTINDQLIDLYGVDTLTGIPIWRIVWSKDQYEA